MDNFSKSRFGDLAKELRDINTKIVELSNQLSVNNHILQEHHKRSTQLEVRIEPIEEDLAHRRKLYSLVMGSSGLLALVSLIVAVIALKGK